MGHNAADVWGYTPRQLSAFQFIADKRKNVDRIEQLTLGSMAARGDEKNLRKTVKELERS